MKLQSVKSVNSWYCPNGHKLLLVGGLEHVLFFHIYIGNVISSQLLRFVHHFSEGYIGQPPTSDFRGTCPCYPLVVTNITMENHHRNFVSFPMNSMVDLQPSQPAFPDTPGPPSPSIFSHLCSSTSPSDLSASARVQASIFNIFDPEKKKRWFWKWSTNGKHGKLP